MEKLKQVPADAFEAVDTSSLMVDPDSGAVSLDRGRYRPYRRSQIGCIVWAMNEGP